jgi:hypothetical protein
VPHVPIPPWSVPDSRMADHSAPRPEKGLGVTAKCSVGCEPAMMLSAPGRQDTNSSVILYGPSTWLQGLARGRKTVLLVALGHAQHQVYGDVWPDPSGDVCAHGPS